MRKTKIVCTLGPACASEAVMKEMLESGMNVARVNMSHGSHELHRKTIAAFRRVRDSLKLPAAVMIDTKGPEIRLGTFKNKKVTLKAGAVFTLTTKEIEGDESAVFVTYRDLPHCVTVGNRILLDDGRITLTVESTSETDITCRVIDGGEISDRKGVNVPHVRLDMPYLSDADEADLRFAVEEDVDFIAASFVRTGDDVLAVRNYLDYYGGHNIKIIAKIENEEGVEHFDEILQISDGIMVARGDMGVEIDFEKLPGLQKKFIRRCYRAGKMVITATQMLESMITNTTPTRAEITDVANAVFDGTSAIMLSGETAVGNTPALVIRVMAKIAEQAEKDAFEMGLHEETQYENDETDTTNAICDAACTTARDIGASAVITMTESGYTARRVSKFRPHMAIIAPTPEVKTFHQLALSWGVYPVMALYQAEEDAMFRHATDCAKMAGLLQKGERVVITAGGRSATALRIQIV
ncbi:MAG: pyruvate kinase [Clostridia bacterium]|nr:pyruvate kinase [Clostridia bacterium]